MTFEELEHAASHGETAPAQCYLSDHMCYQALCHLYDRFRIGRIDRAQATEDKRCIRMAYERRKELDETTKQMFHDYQANILRSSELRAAINKGEHLTLQELFVMAVECISLMTGDMVFKKNAARAVDTQLRLSELDHEIVEV